MIRRHSFVIVVSFEARFFRGKRGGGGEKIKRYVNYGMPRYEVITILYHNKSKELMGKDSYSDRFLRGVHISSRVQETVLDLSVEKQSILEKADRSQIGSASTINWFSSACRG